MTQHTLEVDGSRIEVFEYGAGPPCMLLHGYPQDHNCWRRIIPRLQGQRTLYVPDWFGWGRSERSLSLSLRYEDEFVRIGKLLDLLRIRRLDLVGHDYGGLLSLAYAVHNESRIRSLALINTRAHGKIAFLTRVLLNTMVSIAQLPATRRLIPLLPLKRIHSIMFRRFTENGSFSNEELEGYLSFLNDPSGRQWLAHFYHDFRTTPRAELGELARRLSIPVAIIWGDADAYFPFIIGQDLAQRIPNSAVTRIRGAGHFVVEEKPIEVALALQALFGPGHDF